MQGDRPRETMFEDGKCPMLTSDVIQKYGLSDNFIRRFCSAGCSVKCGELLKEYLTRKGIIRKEKEAGDHDAADEAAGERA